MKPFCLLNWIYDKLNIEFEELWYNKSRLQVDLKITSQYVVQNYFCIRSLIYYDYNMPNLTILKYFISKIP
jgi:hypothetical protein